MRFALYKGTSIISRAIEWQTRGKYSHAAMILNDGSVVEAKEFIGVRRTLGLKSPKGVRVEVFEVQTSPLEDLIIKNFLLAQIGKRYDYSMVLRFITRQGYDPESKKKWFCSELVFAAFRKAGIRLFERTQAWEVPPQMLARSPLAIPQQKI